MNKNQKRSALLLINLGTPDAPTITSVGRYLAEFLNDKYVINIPWLFRKLLVNLIIIPFRVKNSTRLYRQLWTPEGSPLSVYMERLKQKLQAKLEPKVTVFSAMRYRNPSIGSVLAQIKAQGFEQVIILPLYPQFADSTSTSTLEEVKRIVKRWNNAPDIQYIAQFHDHRGYIDTYAEKIQSYNPDRYDFILFSYHGLPNNHIDKGHAKANIETCDCKNGTPEHCQKCYLAACYNTTNLLADRLNLSTDRYTISFQSRLSKDWLEPFSDKTLIDLAKKGHKRVLVVAPAFVADCLETIIEIGIEYKKLFIANGGQELTLVESLNADDNWVSGIQEIIAPQLLTSNF
ncbi:ferrochelatase [Massilibacteroides vaginae]|uniref:ferrochelatase n=1 Tax=Massilibacteroides vaginae TaxID=1673718 RepID=UPI000A1C8478|nr:ferrochelatase [Massilibacteroides vaginae]